MSDPNSTSPVILFVDDEATAVKYFQRAIGPLAPVITASSVEEGKRMLDAYADTLTVLVSDQRMPGEYGNELLHYARERYPHMVRILTTAYSELEHTVEAVNERQMYRYIQKPWDITALRMELKQALEFANLRKEHNQLLREKLVIRQKQIIGNRIGTLHAFCACLTGPEQFLPVEAYLQVASVAGVTPPEPDWLLMDYSDLISAEAMRSGAFGYLVRVKLAELAQRTGNDGSAAIAQLSSVLPGKITMPTNDSAVLQDLRGVVEFLETASGSPVSEPHAGWLAFLIWLGGTGQSLHAARSDQGLQIRVVKPDTLPSPERLAAWIEQF